MSKVGRGMGVLGGMEIVEGEGADLGVNVGLSIGYNGFCGAYSYSLP